MTLRDGPEVTIDVSCSGCKHERSRRYRVQGDSGRDVFCAHPSAQSPDDGEVFDGERVRFVADSRWTTPKWCPMYPKEPTR